MTAWRHWLIIIYFGFAVCVSSSEVPVNKPRDLKPANLISSTFAKIEKNGLPAGWKVTVRGENARFAGVTVERDKKPSQNVVRIQLRKEAGVCLDTAGPAQLVAGKRYLLVVQFKVDDMFFTGHWYHRPAGIWIYVYGTNNKHTWMAVRGEGDTEGWVTALLPFPPVNRKEDAGDFSRTNVILHCYNMVGTVRFRTPMIIEIPKGFDMEAQFELKGASVYGGNLTLKP
ncbi:MAG: hypothetical protein GX629_11255 [Phycisphaerae bacterium]|nr:hypothetical protein [Phycisphaerae bacterium]